MAIPAGMGPPFEMIELALNLGDLPCLALYYRYDTGHAFASDDPIIHTVGLRKDEIAAAKAWERTLEFLGQHLGAVQKSGEHAFTRL